MGNTKIKFGMTSSKDGNIVTVYSNIENVVINYYVSTLSSEYHIVKSFIKKTCLFFGEKRYYITAKRNTKSYEQEIAEAVNNEDFETAQKLKNEWDKLKNK